MTLGQLTWLADEALKSGKITKTAYKKVMNTEIVPKALLDMANKKASDIGDESWYVCGFENGTVKDKFKQGRGSAGTEIRTYIESLERELYED